ncbi:MAG TPA: hypothetical protein VLQ48_01465 [Chloroflexia bacterium]|jgi:hypothetical protein|nr:hypothetical protein [Chloroflexia bacterium]
MQVKTQHGTLNIGNNTKRPAISVAIAPKSATGNYVLVGLLGLGFGFVVGTVATALVGEKSLMLAQHLWTRLTGTGADEGSQVHFELMLQ